MIPTETLAALCLAYHLPPSVFLDDLTLAEIAVFVDVAKKAHET